MGAGGAIEDDAGIPIIAPDGFMEAVLSESISAGPAIRRRGAFMYGNALPSATGQVGTGLRMGSSVGRTVLSPPNELIQKTGEELVVDGVRIVFQMVPGTEVPAGSTSTSRLSGRCVSRRQPQTACTTLSRCEARKCGMQRAGRDIWMRRSCYSVEIRTPPLAAMTGQLGFKRSW
jgi:hypothetical protein